MTSASTARVAARWRQAARELVHKGHKYNTNFYGHDDGGWDSRTGYILGFHKEGYSWEMVTGMSRHNEWRNYMVEGATEHHSGFRKALREMVRQYPELVSFDIKFDGPWKAIRDLVGAPAEVGVQWQGLTFYHGTSSKAWESIERQGLKPRGTTNVNPAYGVGSGAGEGRKDAIYLTTQVAMAHFAARDAAKGQGSYPVVLQIKGLDGRAMAADEDSGETDPAKSLARLGSVAYVGDIPASKIRLHETLEGSRWEKVGAAVPIYAAFVYLSRTKSRGLDADCDAVQDLIEDLKKGDGRAATQAAKALARHPKLRGFQGVVVPAPRSTMGGASLATFAKAMVAAGVGSRVEVPVVRESPVESSRMRRRQGLPGVPYGEHVETMKVEAHGISPDEPVLVLDDIVTTGATIRAVAARLRRAGHQAPIYGAAAGYHEPDPSEHEKCPVDYQTMAANVASQWQRKAGVFEPPPAMMKSILPWVLNVWAGHILTYTERSIQEHSNRLKFAPRWNEVAALLKTIHPAIRNREAIKLDLGFEGMPMVISLTPQDEPTTVVGGMEMPDGWKLGITGANAGVLEGLSGENEKAFRTVEYNVTQHLQKVKEAMVPPNVVRKTKPGRGRSMPLFRHVLQNLYDVQPIKVDKAKESLVEHLRIKKYLNQFANKPKLREVRTYKNFPVDLAGWKYLKGEDQTAFLARLDENWFTKIRVMVVFDGKERDWKGYWDEDRGLLVVASSFYTGPLEAVKKSAAGLKNTLDHEIAHLGQTALQKGRGLSELGGLPSKGIRDPKADPLGRLRERGKQVEHSLRDVEFYTNLRTEMHEVTRQIRRAPLKKREKVLQDFIDNSSKMELLKKEAPRKWAKYVSELRKAVERYLMAARVADLAPPLGWPGGPCHVVNRIEQEVRNERTRKQLTDKAEKGQKITNPEAAKIYDLEAERGEGIAKKLFIGVHAQYRMDLRQVTVPQVRVALKSFSKFLNDLKSQRSPKYDYYSQKVQRSDSIEWTDQRLNLTIVFAFTGRSQIKLISTWWQGEADPPAPYRCDTSLRVAARWLRAGLDQAREALKQADRLRNKLGRIERAAPQVDDALEFEDPEGVLQKMKPVVEGIRDHLHTAYDVARKIWDDAGESHPRLNDAEQALKEWDHLVRDPRGYARQARTEYGDKESAFNVTGHYWQLSKETHHAIRASLTIAQRKLVATQVVARWQRRGGLFQAPPAMMKSIGEWVESVYASYILRRVNEALDKYEARSIIEAKIQQLDEASADIPKLLEAAKRRTKRGVKIDFGAGKYWGTLEIHWILERETRPWGQDELETVPAHWKVSLPGNVYYVPRDDGPDPTAKIREALTEFRPRLEEVLSQTAGIGVGGKEGWRETKPLSKRMFVELKLMEKKLQPLVRGRGRKRVTDLVKTFPIDVRGWSYYPKMSEEVEERLDGWWSNVNVRLTFKPKKGWSGLWEVVGKRLSIVMPSMALKTTLGTAKFDDHMAGLWEVLDHELQHLGQDLLKAIKQLKEDAGLPGKSIRDPALTPSGKPRDPKDRRKIKERFKRVEHPLRDVEFYPNITSMLRSFRKVLKKHPKSDYRAIAREYVGADPPKILYGPAHQFKAMRDRGPRAKWQKAVKEFLKAVEPMLSA